MRDAYLALHFAGNENATASLCCAESGVNSGKRFAAGQFIRAGEDWTSCAIILPYSAPLLRHIEAHLVDRELKHMLRKRQLQQCSTEMVHILLSRKTDCAIMCYENEVNLFIVGQHPAGMHRCVVRIAPPKRPILVRRNLSRLSLSPDHNLPGTWRLSDCRVPTGPAYHNP